MKADLLEIITHYGVLPQLKYFQSEVFELNEAILSLEKRNPFQIEGDEIDNIAEEIADCLVMLNQFKEYYDISDKQIKDIMLFKIKRQLERIEEE